MLIDPQDGSIHLSNSLVVTPALTQSEFRASGLLEHASEHNCNTLPWLHFRLAGGLLGKYPLLATVFYYGEMLVRVDMAVDLHPGSPRSWENWTEDGEAETKVFHDDLLRRELGEPHDVIASGLHRGSPLGYANRYRYGWGEVGSGYDDKGSFALIWVTYRGRMEKASADYRDSGTRGRK